MAVPEPVSGRDNWLTLEQASKRLGVHATTLRRWADEGAVDAFVTPGGHRRFRLADLERFEGEHRRARLPALPEQRWSDHAITHARQSVPHQRWAVAYDGAEREAKRQLGRRLIGLVFQHLASRGDSPHLLAEARAIGQQHARDGLSHGQSLIDLLQAISFFRTTMLEVSILELPQTVAAQPETSTRLLRRIEQLLDAVQTGVVELYQSGASS